MCFSRGSEWGRWDLHVHTPFSALNNQFGSDWDIYVKTLYNKAIQNNIKAIGITDYFIIDGYTKLKNDYLNKGTKLAQLFEEELEKEPSYLEKVKNILILPNIEFRLDNAIYYLRNGTEIGNKKLQYHIIFDNNVEVRDIEDNFLHQIKFKATATVDNGIDHRPLTHNNLVSLGANVKKYQKEFQQMSDFEAGLNCAGVTLDDIQKALDENKNMFKNRYLLLVVEDDITNIKWGDQAHMTRKVLYSVANGIFSANQRTIDWGLAETTEKEFSSLKPCLWGSDAHDFDKLFNPDGIKYCWIKANPTFTGLKQVFFTPKERVYIGYVPPKLDVYKKNITQYIDKISIHKKTDAINSEIWFDDDLPLSIGLTTIIGNKGSGKSALSDILGYLCSSKNMKYGSFLIPDRFRKENKHFADDYHSTVFWKDGHSEHVDSLSHEKSESEVQRAQYLPQKYIENTCNNLGDEFQKEIDNVIFSYIDKKDRGDANSLQELISNRSSLIRGKIQEIRNRIENINIEIIKKEDKQNDKYKQSISEKVSYLIDELRRTKENEPPKVEIPKESPDFSISTEISRIDQLIEKHEKDIKEFNNKISNISTKILDLTELQTQLIDFKEKYNQIKSKVENARINYGISEDEFSIDIVIRDSGIKLKIKNLQDEKTELAKLVDQSFDADSILFDERITSSDVEELVNSTLSLSKKNAILLKYKAFLNNRTTIGQQKYQKYLDDYKVWQNRISSIQKGSDTEMGIDAYVAEQAYIETKLKEDLLLLYTTRLNLVIQIFEQMQGIVKIHQDIYRPVEEKLKVLLQNIDDQVAFTSDIVPLIDLSDEILRYINQRISGDFQGSAKGTSFMNEIIRATDFNDGESVRNFADKTFEATTKDINKLNSLVKERLAFNNFISGLSYLKVDYTLKMGLKQLKELSPGERGTVLLIFYLALEKSNCPLIIDQPEDNLDNQSVYSKLVPCIRNAKNNRQVIIVTHNPNIAVACDAEQIIYSEINKSNNQIRYISGGIENEKIRDKVIDILEGTKPAFDLRKIKYTE